MDNRTKQFINWCVINIDEWKGEYSSCVRFFGSNNKWWKHNVEWRTHYKSLSKSYWVVCTKKDWLDGKQKLEAKREV